MAGCDIGNRRWIFVDGWSRRELACKHKRCSAWFSRERGTIPVRLAVFDAEYD